MVPDEPLNWSPMPTLKFWIQVFRIVMWRKEHDDFNDMMYIHGFVELPIVTTITGTKYNAGTNAEQKP